MASSNKYEQEIDEAKDLVISAIGETMDLYGINRSVGNLYGTMVFEQHDPRSNARGTADEQTKYEYRCKETARV